MKENKKRRKNDQKGLMPSKENDEERTAQQHTSRQRQREKSFEFVIPASTFFFLFSCCSRTFRSRLSLSPSFVCCVINARAHQRQEREREKRDEDKMVAAAKWKRRRDGGPGKRSFYFFFRLSLSLSLSPELSFAPVLRFLDVRTYTPFPQRIRNKKTQQPTGELVEAFFLYILYNNRT